MLPVTAPAAPAALAPAAPADRPQAPWTVADVVQFLGMSEPTVRRHIRDGTIKSFKIGNHRYIADAEVRRLAAGG